MTTKRTVVDLYVHETHKRLLLRADRTVTMRMVSGRPVTVFQLCGAGAFHEGGSVLLPLPPDGRRLTALDVLAAALFHAEDEPEAQLLSAAHVAGGDELLSRRRAASVARYLTGERVAWAAAALAEASIADWQRVLLFVHRTQSWDCDPGPIDGLDGPLTQRAVHQFRARFSRERRPIPREEGPNQADWEAFFETYDLYLARLLDEDMERLAARRAALGEVRGVGCAGHWPLDRLRLKAFLPLDHERVDLLFFAAKDAPKLRCHAEETCAFKRCDLYRKNKYRSVEPGAGQGDSRRRVDLLELEDVNFHYNSAVLLPDPRAEAADPAGQERIRGLAVVKTVLEFVELFPDKRTLIAGHTDKKGSDAFNVELSQERADNVHAYLRGDRARWAAVCQARFQVEDWQQVLKFAARTRGYDCDPGPVDNISGPNSQQALRNFRREYGVELGNAIPEQGPLSEADWGAFYDCYELELAQLLACSAQELTTKRARIRYLDPPAVGCGEHFPVGGLAVDGEPRAEDRRVELMFFDADETPDLPCHAQPGCDPAVCDLHRPDLFVRRHLPVDVSTLLDVVRVRLFDEAGQALRSAPFRITSVGGQLLGDGQADGEGFVEIKLRDVPEQCDLSWGDPSLLAVEAGDPDTAAETDPPEFAFRSRLFLNLAAGGEREQATRRLHNLGYDRAREFADNLRDFQFHNGLAETGELDAPTRALLLARHDQGQESGAQAPGAV